MKKTDILYAVGVTAMLSFFLATVVTSAVMALFFREAAAHAEDFRTAFVIIWAVGFFALLALFAYFE